MSDAPEEFDLKFLPDWLKESPAVNRYADYQGDTGERPRRERDDRGPRGPRPERGGPPPGHEGERRGSGANRPAGDRGRGPRPGGNRGAEARTQDRGREGRPQDRGRDQRPQRDAPRQEPARPPAQLRIDFLPEPNAAAGIARQIKSSGRAFAVFTTSKLFLDRPERHRVRIASADTAVPLYQLGDGPIAFDRATLERGAFVAFKDEFYAEQKVEGEPIKGNFSNVARSRSTGALLGPTNHHGYQPALRKLYEERFSRRMSFPEFQREDVEVVSGEQVVADWKEQARTTTVLTAKKEAEPLTFKSLAEAEQHFRQHYLPQLVKSGTPLECAGPASRAALDRFVSGAVREAWESESRFPQQMVNALRPYFAEAGLQFFKHRKRILFVSAIKPVRHPAGQALSDGITAILKTIESSPRVKRPELAAKILGPQAAPESPAPETSAGKAQLAADLHYLLHAGHVIEFADGTLDLPLAPQENPAPQVSKKTAPPKPERAIAGAASELEKSNESEKPDEPHEGSGIDRATEQAVETAPEIDAPGIEDVHPTSTETERATPPPETVEEPERVPGTESSSPAPEAAVEAAS